MQAQQEEMKAQQEQMMQRIQEQMRQVLKEQQQLQSPIAQPALQQFQSDVQNVVWVKVPYSNGQVLHVPSGRFMHEDRDFAKSNKQSKPPDVLLKCHEVWRGGGFTKEIVLKFEHTWSKFYELLEEEFGEKVVFDYQDRGGRMVTVDDHEKFERFCQAVDDATLPNLDTTPRKYGTEINVYIRPYSSELQDKVKGGMDSKLDFKKGQSAQAIGRDGDGGHSGGAHCFKARCTIS
mmetsp:Transcript_15795/g.33608  ORF Transcript_15795/g.33608 Transcript_15795/m.33608 type:complete len:234 (-) Transcript_15795:23-724(-)